MNAADTAYAILAALGVLLALAILALLSAQAFAAWFGNNNPADIGVTPEMSGTKSFDNPESAKPEGAPNAVHNARL